MADTVLIPNFNGAKWLRACLSSLAAQTVSPTRVVIIDNGSNDESAIIAREHGAEFLPLDRNYGFARAVNEGLRLVTTDFVVILNNDVRLGPDYLAWLQSASADFSTGCILQEGSTLIDAAFDLPSRSFHTWRAGHGCPAEPPWLEPRTVSFVPLTAARFRTTLLRDLGGLDEHFESYLEDVDLGWRCARAGRVGRYVPQALAWHLGSATWGAGSAAQVERLARNVWLLAAKHAPPGWAWRYGRAALAGHLLWGALQFARGRGAVWLRGTVHGVRCYFRLRQTTDRCSGTDFLRIVRASESTLRELQPMCRMDTYWRWFFRLAGGA